MLLTSRSLMVMMITPRLSTPDHAPTWQDFFYQPSVLPKNAHPWSNDCSICIVGLTDLSIPISPTTLNPRYTQRSVLKTQSWFPFQPPKHPPLNQKKTRRDHQPAAQAPNQPSHDRHTTVQKISHRALQGQLTDGWPHQLTRLIPRRSLIA